MNDIVLNKIDQDIDRRIIGFKVAGYYELKLVSDVVEYGEYLDMYSMAEEDAYKWGVHDIWAADCLFCIHVPKNSSYADEEYYDMIEDDINDFIKEECRKDIVESIIRTAKKIDEGYGVSFKFSTYSNDWVLGYKYPEEFENIDDTWTELLVEPVKHYNYLTIKEEDYLLEKLNE